MKEERFLLSRHMRTCKMESATKVLGQLNVGNVAIPVFLRLYIMGFRVANQDPHPSVCSMWKNVRKTESKSCHFAA
jgi:hypothetical protein